MRQESQGCFTQLDRSLALPRVRARVLQQQMQTAWREAEFRKLDQALAAPELQVGTVSVWTVIAEVNVDSQASASGEPNTRGSPYTRCLLCLQYIL